MKRLGNASLDSLPASVARPAYDRSAVTPGIVHLGVGAFHRAHQAAMTEAALAAGARDWGIIAASLRSPDTRDALALQDGLYTLAVRSEAGERFAVIGAISEIIVAPENPARLVAAMADPRIRIVSLTVTEKGYCHDPATGRLDETHPDIVHDLAHPDRPRSAPGFLLAALRLRQAASVAPFTVLCCDNLPANGRTVHRVLTRMAERIDPRLGAFVAAHLACPSTMVDRIVPATTDQDRASVAAALGVSDAWPVVTEPFLQWVIEDHFPTGRPAWEIAGAEFVADVAPHELMKLRMLNGAHSAIAYLGSLAGHAHVADAAGDPLLVALIRGLWRETQATLPRAAGLDPEAYGNRLLARFRNPSLKHRLLQIAMDGSQKLPQRLIAPLRERRKLGAPVDHLALAIAGFLRHMTGVAPDGAATDVRDPLAAVFAARAAGDPGQVVRAMLGVEAVFGDLAGDETAVALITGHFERISREGVRAAVAHLTGAG